ncbi:MAG: hypothetical protein KGQ79_00720 [Proteobacteria bacterium]|nr:hypothetical protein [Pseudomonadota bacterium]MBU6424901.1 hypothetical protein [Rhodospirillales bacterium]
MQDQPQNLRGLKAAVGIMGVLIIIGTTVVVGTIIHRLYASFAAPSTPQAAVGGSAVPGEIPAGAAAQLAPGERISGIASAGADVAVWVSGPKGDRLLLLNPVTGQARAVLASPSD